MLDRKMALSRPNFIKNSAKKLELKLWFKEAETVFWNSTNTQRHSGCKKQEKLKVPGL